MIQSSPQVSVCIPVYNGAAYLHETLASICSQKGVDLEIVVSDDQSSDSSMQIVEEFQAAHRNLKWVILLSPERLGMAGNWNACLNACAHEFVKILGQDDLLLPGALFAQAALLAEYPKAALVSCGCDIYGRNGRKLFKRPRLRPSGIYEGSKIIRECLAIRGNAIGEPVTAMARREDFLAKGGFSSVHRYYIDMDMWFRLLDGRDYGFIQDSQAGFRIHGNAVSSASQQDDLAQFEALPFAAEFSATLSPIQKVLRYCRSRFATFSRKIIYRFLG